MTSREERIALQYLLIAADKKWLADEYLHRNTHAWGGITNRDKPERQDVYDTVGRLRNIWGDQLPQVLDGAVKDGRIKPFLEATSGLF